MEGGREGRRGEGDKRGREEQSRDRERILGGRTVEWTRNCSSPGGADRIFFWGASPRFAEKDGLRSPVIWAGPLSV